MIITGSKWYLRRGYWLLGWEVVVARLREASVVVWQSSTTLCGTSAL